MSKSALNIFIRVVTRRMEAGEDLEEILDSFTKLTPDEKEEIRKNIIEN